MEGDSQLLDWITSKCHKDGVIDIEEGWAVLTEYGFVPLRQMLLAHSLNGAISTGRFCSLYSVSYKLTTQHQHQDYLSLVYTRMKYLIEQILQEDMIPQLVRASGINMIKEFVQIWNSHKLLTRWMYKLFMHLDPCLVHVNSSPSVTSCCLSLFYDIVFQSVKEQISSMMIAMFRQIREDENKEFFSEYLAECSQVFVIMGAVSTLPKTSNLSHFFALPSQIHIYEKEFEIYFLEDTLSFYKTMSKRLITNNRNIFTYLLQVENLLTQETERCQHYLHQQTVHKVRVNCINALIVSHSDVIFKELINAMSDLARTILSHDIEIGEITFRSFTSEFTPLLSTFHLFSIAQSMFPSSQYLRNLSLEFSRFGTLMSDALRSRYPSTRLEKSATNSYVRGVISILLLMAEMSSQLFQDDSLFIQQIKKSSKTIVNADIDSLSAVELYATYCEAHMQGEGDDTPQLEKFMNIVFPAIENKDLFLDIYQRLMSKRLLGEKRISVDTEKLMISLMKLQSGVSFTVKLEGMLNDHLLANSLFHSWKSSSYSNEIQIDFNFKVLTTSFWPIFPKCSINLPSQLHSCEILFTKWYLESNSSRALKWNYSLGEVILLAKYPSPAGYQIYEINVTLEQATVILLFNTTLPNEYTFESIHQFTGIEEKRLKRVLHSLSCQNFKILEKSNSSSSSSSTPLKILNSDVFWANTNFSSKQRKFKILMPLNGEEPKSSEKHLEIERGAIVDATIVRIMKSRRVLTHVNLIAEISQQISSFQPENKLMKSRIGLLIEKGYLERDENDSTVYRYLP